MTGLPRINDLSDPMVRALSDRNHVPREIWAIGGGTHGVACRECHQPWPCETRKALRQICTCPAIDVSTLDGERSYAKGYSDRCPVCSKRDRS